MFVDVGALRDVVVDCGATGRVLSAERAEDKLRALRPLTRDVKETVA
jgi:hypothetical protein